MNDTQRIGAIGDLRFAIDWVKQAQSRMDDGSMKVVLATISQALEHVREDLENDDLSGNEGCIRSLLNGVPGLV